MKKVNVRGGRGIAQRKTAPASSLLSRGRAVTSLASDSKRKKSKPEAEFDALLKKHGYRDYEVEGRFHESRKWRVDFIWPLARVAIEIEGGVWMRGRHVRPAGFINDCEKYNALTLAGYKVYRIPVVKGWQDAAMAFVRAERLT